MQGHSKVGETIIIGAFSIGTGICVPIITVVLNQGRRFTGRNGSRRHVGEVVRSREFLEVNFLLLSMVSFARFLKFVQEQEWHQMISLGMTKVVNRNRMFVRETK
jgi:hypothetical protein